MLGAIIGDIAGSVYEFYPVERTDFPLFTPQSKFTDDTVLTIAVADAFIHNKDMAKTIQNYAREYEGRGYGGKFFSWIYDENPEPYGSYGNGSAMRVSSAGWLGNDINEVLELAYKSAAVTHNHVEGIKGAQAVALAIFLARKGSSKYAIQDEISERFNYDLSRSLSEIEKDYAFNETCQQSVPEAITAFLYSDDYESAIRNAIWLKGDADTQASIAGSIAEAFYKEIPQELKNKAYELLPKEFVVTLYEFSEYLRLK